MCSSSGEDSDNSHASRGCLGPQEARNIERTMAAVLGQWHQWARSSSASSSFQECFLGLFSDQDDRLFEGLLCLLDIHVAAGVLSDADEEEGEGEDSAASAPRRLDPVDMFETVVGSGGFGWDASVVLDFLISSETCFLLYFLRFVAEQATWSHGTMYVHYNISLYSFPATGCSSSSGRKVCRRLRCRLLSRTSAAAT